MNFRQLFPEPAQLPLAAFPEILAPLRDRASGRPYTVANFVSSVDGRGTIGGHATNSGRVASLGAGVETAPARLQ